MANLSTTYVGLKLKNPIIVSSAGITGTAELIKRAADNGAGAVVMKSLGDRTWTSPRFAVLHDPASDQTTFYSVEGHSKLGDQGYADQVAKAKASVDIPVIASITSMNDALWTQRAQLMEQAGADALELDISCPHGAHMLIGKDTLAEIGRVTELVKSAIHIPVIPKLTPQASDPIAVALDAQAHHADAIVMFNRFTGLDVDIRAQAPILHGGYAGHGGAWAIRYVMRWISEVYPKLKIPIASSGGIATAEDVVKMLLVGATTVQTCTAVILNGYGIVNTLVRGLEKYMDEMGHATIDEFRGRATERLQGAATVDRTRKFMAAINAELCTACAQCELVCIYDAPKPTDLGAYAIDPVRCSGCGLCAYLCATEAITISEVK